MASPIYLSLIIPAFNEHGTLRTTLRSVDHYLAHQDYRSEIIVIDDGSPGGLDAEIVASSVPIRFLRSERNQGKGAAVRWGVASAHGRYSCYMDADHSVAITHLPAFLDVLEQGYDLVSGSRFLPTSRIVHPRPRIRRCASHVLRTLVRALLMPQVTDSQCGFKCFRSDVGKMLFAIQRTHRYGFDIEFLARGHAQGWCLKELPVVWQNSESTSKIHVVPDSLRTAIEVVRIACAMAVHKPLCPPSPPPYGRGAISDVPPASDVGARAANGTHRHGHGCGDNAWRAPRAMRRRLRAVHWPRAVVELSKLGAVLLLAGWLALALAWVTGAHRGSRGSYSYGLSQ